MKQSILLLVVLAILAFMALSLTGCAANKTTPLSIGIGRAVEGWGAPTPMSYGSGGGRSADRSSEGFKSFYR